MSPQEKLSKDRVGRNGNLNNPDCPYCNFHFCWKHGKYKRNGFHDLPLIGYHQAVIEVLRYLCRNPVCKHTFSVLPEKVLPYCRFTIGGLLRIFHFQEKGRSAYWMEKNQWPIRARIIVGAIHRIKEVTSWLKQLYREATGKVEENFKELVKIMRERLTWPRLTRQYYHHFYPGRFGHILNPHNSGINSP